LALALWLLVKGFNERQHPVDAEANVAKIARMS
jgi:hypothetical protein